jgi:gluconokinase
MGVSGAGKSTVGRLVAERLGIDFVDADDLHPATNVEKMATGTPLTDEDRTPWLAIVGQTLADSESTGAVVACSALKRDYRDSIRKSAPRAIFAELYAEPELLRSRMTSREWHFMPASLLESQVATLEHLQSDERGLRVDAAEEPAALTDAITRKVLATLA